MECYASRGFPRYTFKRYLAFPKQAEYLYLYKAKFREKVAYKSGLEYLLERFLLGTFAQVISVFPKNLKTFLD